MSGFEFITGTAPAESRETWVACVPTGPLTTMALFDLLATRLRFPSYFGRNWDALNDCLADFGWAPQELKSVVIWHSDIPLTENSDVENYVGCLSDACRDVERVTLRVIFPPNYEGKIKALAHKCA